MTKTYMVLYVAVKDCTILDTEYIESVKSFVLAQFNEEEVSNICLIALPSNVTQLVFN